MKHFSLLLTIILFSLLITANDGVFYANGNHLIPIFETDISVKKEILTLRKINNQYVEVTVYYEFFNPKDEKTIVVGFEAFSPEGDAERMPVNGFHPYIKDFTVLLNNTNLMYQVAFVSDSTYAKNGIVNSLREDQLKDEDGSYYYVYYFNATFKKGLNIVKHTYRYNLSGTVDMNYNIEYILTAAKRWANKQIDDFTLIIDTGEFESFFVNRTFFNNLTEWKIDGNGNAKFISQDRNYYFDTDAVKFNIRDGNIVFKQKNFNPQGELFLYSMNYNFTEDAFNYRTDALPYSLNQQERIADPLDGLSKKILRNLPFARRGYVFTNQEIQRYYETMTDWYIPDNSYKADINLLTGPEKELVLKWKD